MKLLLVFIAALTFMAFVTSHLNFKQPEKEAILRLNRAEMEAMYSIVDESATPGNIRKPLLQKLAVAYEATWPSRPAPAPIKQDTTTKQKKN